MKATYPPCLFAGATHPGCKRQKNEDRYLIAAAADGASLLAVADGMGGHPGGGDAAQVVVETLAAFHRKPEGILPVEQALSQTLMEANKEILARGAEQPELAGMGSTAVAALLREGRLHWAHVGDSRLYLLRRGRLEQITTDHTFLRELVEHGDMTAAEAASHPLRNILDQCVGCEDCLPEYGAFRLQPDDRLLLCTDGLHHELKEAPMAALLTQNRTPEKIVEHLVQQALESGGRDNVTVVVGLCSRLD